ncbi:MAG TPA: hypothetical protein PKB05_07360 [Oligoflexia bacterium]|nr:hypothetical protein [Oligoflexia bacterium]
MTSILKYFSIILLISICIVFAYFNIGRKLNGFENFQIQHTGLHKKNEPLELNKDLADKFLSIEQKLNLWWKQNNRNWKPTPATYINNFVITTDKGSLNFLDETVIVNCCGRQYSKTLSKEEKDFIEQIKVSMNTLFTSNNQ